MALSRKTKREHNEVRLRFLWFLFNMKIWMLLFATTFPNNGDHVLPTFDEDGDN